MNEREEPTPRDLIAERITLHSARLKSLIGARCGPAVLAITTVDDIYQETITEMMSSAHTTAEQSLGQFFSWAGTIARRVISRKLKAAKRDDGAASIRRAGSTGDGISESMLHSSRRSPSSSAAGHEAADRLHQAIETLSESHREVLTLYKLEERPLAEVAKKLGKGKGATCQLLARAQAALAKRLEE